MTRLHAGAHQTEACGAHSVGLSNLAWQRMSCLTLSRNRNWSVSKAATKLVFRSFPFCSALFSLDL